MSNVSLIILMSNVIVQVFTINETKCSNWYLFTSKWTTCRVFGTADTLLDGI